MAHGHGSVSKEQLMSDRSEEDKDRRWRKLSAIGSFLDAAARLAEILTRW